MKISVAQAVVLIRNKPSGLSGAEYARVLARKLRSQDEGWRKRSQELEQEVLMLRQEALIARATAAEDDPIGPEGGGFSWESLTPPPSGPPGRLLLPSVRLLQSLCSLRQVEGSGGGLWFRSGGGSGPVLADAVCQLLESVVAVCRDPPPLGPPDLVLQACRVGGGAMDVFCSQRLPSEDFLRRVQEALRELTGTLLDRNQQGGAADRLTGCLIRLGDSGMSKSFLIRHILSQISALVDQLWQAFQQEEGGAGLDTFPVDQYQNSSYLFGVVEHLLQKVPFRLEVGAEPTGFLAHLEQRAFQLSEEFPLFSIYMWRIGGLLRSDWRSSGSPGPDSGTP
ncbi:meiosis-specific protein MEI4-like [Brachionichthys hirsutus]|uniref:meiosis-specific protein MEI4-like n=1 Tax=Brachionichthys hirsutus TaxID=412623 RepID=UPI003604F07E